MQIFNVQFLSVIEVGKLSCTEDIPYLQILFFSDYLGG